jgi:tetratricopeptide (TPR) repeat protein
MIRILRGLRPVLALPAVAGRVVLRHRRLTIPLSLALALAATAAGSYGYALHRWHRAEAALKAQGTGDARPDLEFCLAVWPRSAAVHRLAARDARIRGDLETAEAHLNRCRQLEHGASADTQLEFLLIRVQQGEADRLTPDLIEYVERKHPDAPLILETLARAYLNNRRYGPALVMIDRWVQEKPRSAEPYYWRGWVLERLQEPGASLLDYQQALELDPGYVPVRLRLAEYYLEKNSPPDALPLLEALHKQYPERVDVRVRLGHCRFLQGDLADARRLLESAARDEPNDTAVLLLLGKLELADGRYADAEKWLRAVLAIDPHDLEALFHLAQSLQNQDGRQEEAAAVMAQHKRDKALLQRGDTLMKEEARQASADAGRPTEIGTIFLRLGQDRLGVYWLMQALERDPRHAPALRALAEHFEAQGERQQAALLRRRLAELEKKAAP